MADLADLKLSDYLGNNSADFLTQLNKSSLDDTAKKYLIGDYIAYNSGQSLRRFSFTPDAKLFPNWGVSVTFDPTFEHRQWHDGEDLVEAEGTDGFNKRFNAIRADLESIKANLLPVFAGLQVLQEHASKAMDQIAAELNAINQQIYEIKNPKGSGPVIKFPTYPIDVVPTYPPQIVNPPINYPWQFKTPEDYTTNPKIWLDGANPDKAVIAGLPADRIDQVAFNGKNMDVWKTNMGLMLTDAAPAAVDAPKPSYIAPELTETQQFNKFLADNAPEIKTKFPNGFTKKQFEDEYGSRALGGQVYAQDPIKALPDDMTFASTDALADAVAGQQAKVLVNSGEGRMALVGAVGLQSDSTDDIAINMIKFTDTTTADQLQAAGIKTVGELANADVNTLHTRMLAKGFTGSVGDIAGIKGIGNTLAKMGKI